MQETNDSLQNKPLQQTDIIGSNPDDGYLTLSEASEYINRRKEWWGSNLIGWVEERNGRFFPCFNVWD